MEAAHTFMSVLGANVWREGNPIVVPTWGETTTGLPFRPVLFPSLPAAEPAIVFDSLFGATHFGRVLGVCPRVSAGSLNVGINAPQEGITLTVAPYVTAAPQAFRRPRSAASKR